MNVIKKMQIKLIILLTGVVLSFCLTGCWDAKSMGVGRRPYLPYVPSLQFTIEETIKLNEWSKELPSLFTKLQKHSNLQADLLRKYNEENIKVEKIRLKALGYEDDEISATIYAGLRKVGYPPDSNLAKDYMPKL